MITAPPLTWLMAMEFRFLARKMQLRKSERVYSLFEQAFYRRGEIVPVALEDLRGRDRHRRIQIDRKGRRQFVFRHALAQEKQDFLGPFEREGRNDDISPARQGGIHHLMEFLQGLVERPVQPVAIGRFHHHGVGGCGNLRRRQQARRGAADIAGKKCAADAALFLHLDQDAGGAQNMARIVEGRAHPRTDLDRLFVGCRAPEPRHAIGGIDDGVERRRRRGMRLPVVMTARFGLLGLQIGRIQHDQPRQFGGRLGGDDLTLKSPLHQKRQPAAMIEMRMGEQNEVDRARVEAERDGVILIELAAALEQAAIHQDAAPLGFHQMAGPRDALGRAVE